MKLKDIYNEGALGADITGKYSPNNKLLKPEFEPNKSHMTTPKTEPMDELIDFDELADNLTPGFGPQQYAQKDNKKQNTNIVKNLTKRNKKLFDRDTEGTITIPGIHSDNKKAINKEHSKLLQTELEK